MPYVGWLTVGNTTWTMTSSMLAGERKWATARKGGMTVLGKVNVPKPLNLPSQRSENHGMDPNVAIVPKGTLSWGSRGYSSSSDAKNSSVSLNADGGVVSPRHRPSSGGGTRPSTAGSDLNHEPSGAWGSNSRPSSAAGTYLSNESALSSRPRSAETRPNSSQLSRFAEPDHVVKNSSAWGPDITRERLDVKQNGFSLNSGDFPTLGADRVDSTKNIEYEAPAAGWSVDPSCPPLIPSVLSITRPDDWHLHLRDGELLASVVSHSSQHFARAIIMPNLKPPVTTTAAAVTYREWILKALPDNSDFNPLMTLYLTDTTSPNEIKLARESGVVYAVKLYPAGATTNSQDGVTDLFGKCLPVLEEMVRQNMPLLVHGEVTSLHVDVFDREKVFIDTILSPLVEKLPQLKIVMEHITTMDAVNFVLSCDERFVAATVTPQHLVLNRNSLFHGGLQPHNYCLPVLKREKHRQAIVNAVTSGSRQFFLGTDSAPHERRRKEQSCGCAGIYNAPVALSAYAKVFEEAGALDKLEAFTSFNGPDFYGLPRNNTKIKLTKMKWEVPEFYSFVWGELVPMHAGETLEWLPSVV